MTVIFAGEPWEILELNIDRAIVLTVILPLRSFIEVFEYIFIVTDDSSAYVKLTVTVIPGMAIRDIGPMFTPRSSRDSDILTHANRRLNYSEIVTVMGISNSSTVYI